MVIGVGISNNSRADSGETRLYSTREEKREAGVKHEITPWLIASGLAEIEGEWRKFDVEKSDNDDFSRSRAATVQIGIDVLPVEWAQVEILTEYDTDTSEWILDEATLALELVRDKDAWEVVIGQQALDFGVYFSHFASGPALEFGETNDYAITLAYSHDDIIDINASVYRGDARKFGSDDSLDYSVALETWFTDNLAFGTSYISDLADSEARILDETGNRYRNKVPAISGYLLWVEDVFEISFEALGALEEFSEFSKDRDQPVAWNAEFTHFLSPKIDWSFRLEGSHELEDEPEIQFGLALNYRLHENIVITSELLHGLFRDNLATSNKNRPYESVTTLGGLVTIAF